MLLLNKFTSCEKFRVCFKTVVIITFNIQWHVLVHYVDLMQYTRDGKSTEL